MLALAALGASIAGYSGESVLSTVLGCHRHSLCSSGLYLESLRQNLSVLWSCSLPRVVPLVSLCSSRCTLSRKQTQLLFQAVSGFGQLLHTQHMFSLKLFLVGHTVCLRPTLLEGKLPPLFKTELQFGFDM